MAQHLHLAITLGGYLGGLLVLAGYALTSSGRLPVSSPAAQAVSTTGALLLVANGVALAAWPSVGVNLAWIAIGAAAVWRSRPGRTTSSAASTDAVDLAAVPSPRSCADGGARVWPGDWDAAAEQLTAETAAGTARSGAPTAAAAVVPPTAPLPVLGESGRPLA